MTGKTVQGRAVYLVFGFYAQAPTKSPVMPRLDADEVQATRKLIPTAREVRGYAGNSPPRCHELHAQAEATNSGY